MASTRRRLKRMPRLKGKKKTQLPVLVGAAPRVAEREGDELQKIIRTLGGTTEASKLAKQVMALKPEYPAASLPELVTFVWLKAYNIPFTFQAMLFGGRRAKGGLVPDFVIQYGGKGMAWMIQGEYWHDRATRHGQKDTDVRLRLLGTIYKGVSISDVVELWEKDIYRLRPRVFQYALNGIGLRE